MLATTAATAIALGCIAFVFCYKRHNKGLIMREKKNGSAYEHICLEGVNNQPLIENGNVYSEPTWYFICLRFIHYNMIMDAKIVIWFLLLW